MTEKGEPAEHLVMFAMLPTLLKAGDEMKMIDEHPRDIERIVQDPEILSGKPVVKGTRISVAIVLEYLAHNPDFDELFADYPRLTLEDVKACLAYANALVEAVPKAKERAALSAL